MTQYLRDQHGVDWPLTGHWCITCGWPLTPIRHGQDQHLHCEVDVLVPATSGLEQTLLADAAAQRSDTPGPPGRRVWVDMPDTYDDGGRLDWIYVTDAELSDRLIEPCPICHMRRWSPRTGGYGLYILDAEPDPWLFCPFCSASCFCLVCGHQVKPTDRHSTDRFPDLCDSCGTAQENATTEAVFEFTRQLGARPLNPR